MRNSVLGIVCLGVLGAPLAAASECYGPVGNSETLWPIALRLRPDPSISPQRMMLALLEANPEAFSRANVNALNAGSTLCFGPGELIGLDEEAAIAVVGRHNREWRSGSEELGAGSNESMPAASGPAGGEEGEPAVVRVPDAVAAFDSRLAQLERRIGDLEAEPDLDPDRIERALALLEMRVARIEDQVRLLSGWIEAQGTAAGQQAMEPMPTPAPQGDEAMEPMPTPAPQGDEAMEPMPTPAPQGDEAMEPMPTPAPQGDEAMEPMPTPAPQSDEAMEPMPTPAPQGDEAMEPMPTPAPQGDEAMEPMPTPAPQGDEAMEPMPTPAPQGDEAMEPMPTPAPQGDEAMEPMPTPAPQGDEAMEPMPTPAPMTTRESTDPEPAAATEERDSDETLTTESVSARIAAWRERVRKLLNR